MQLIKLALFAAAASAVPGADKKHHSAPFEVTRFRAEHEPQSSYAITRFHVKGPGFDTHCHGTKPSKSSNGLAPIGDGRCEDKKVTWKEYPVHNQEHAWIFSVSHHKDGGKETKYTTTGVKQFSEKGSSFTWDKLDLPSSFRLHHNE